MDYIKATDCRKLSAFEMRCYRRIILKVISILERQTATLQYREKVERRYTIVNVIKHRKLQLFAQTVNS